MMQKKKFGCAVLEKINRLSMHQTRNAKFVLLFFSPPDNENYAVLKTLGDLHKCKQEHMKCVEIRLIGLY